MPISFSQVQSGLVNGLTDIITLGTGTSMPTGIESLFEYNGTLLNDTSTIEKVRITEIAGLDDADIRDQREVNPSSHGETAFNSFYGGRTIVLSGRIEAFTLDKLRDMQMGLKQIFASLVELPLIIRTGDPNRDVYINCRKSANIAMKESQGDFRFFRDFQITLRASDPRFLSLTRKISTVTVPTLTSLSLTNRGNFFSEPEIHFVGSLTGNIVISNDLTGQTVTITGNIAAGQEYVLNIQKKTFKDASGNNKWSQFSVTSDWLILAPGVNTLTITSAGAAVGSSISVYYNDAYI